MTLCEGLTLACYMYIKSLFLILNFFKFSHLQVLKLKRKVYIIIMCM